MTPRLTALSLLLGLVAGLALHIAWPSTFDRLFVPFATVAAFFVVAAPVRRQIWQEKSACIFIAGSLVAFGLHRNLLVGFLILIGLIAYLRISPPDSPTT